jgi:putative DNA primase/helicase
VELTHSLRMKVEVPASGTRGDSVPRCIGDDNVPHAFPTFCPKAIGMKGKRLPDTTLSRSIVIELKRKRANDQVEHFRSVDDSDLAELRQRALRWSIDNAEALKDAEPDMPAGFDNRLGDNWRLLFAIADLAGGEWPEKARQAARVLSEVADTASIGVRLLADIKTIFGAVAGDVLSSSELVEKLTAGGLAVVRMEIR